MNKKKLHYKLVTFKERLFPGRSIPVYLVVEAPIVDEDGNIDQELKIYSVVPRLEDVPEAVEALVFKEHESHFNSWCDLRNLNPDNTSSWDKYVETVIGPKNLAEEVQKYSYFKIKLNSAEIATIMRGYHGCEYLGCSFESIEKEVNENMKQAIEEAAQMINDEVVPVAKKLTEQETDINKKIDELEHQIKEFDKAQAAASSKKKSTKTKKTIDK